LRRVAAPAGAPAELTRFNATRFAAVDVKPVETFWFTAKNGRRIHNLMTLPPGYDPARKYPLVTLIHGGPHNMSGDGFGLRWPPHLIAAGGYLVLQTNYTGSTGFGEAFAQAIKGDPLRGPADELLEAIDEAARRYPAVDLTRIGASGASYGGHLVNWLQGHSDRFKVFVSHSGLVSLESQWGTSDGIYHRERSAGGPPWELSPIWREQSPHLSAANFKTPILLSVGEKDFRVPINNTLEMWSILQRQRVPSRLLVYPDENHWIQNAENSRHHLGEVAAWLKRWL
jgi:dipeptidyl aminopeptidase/acylaminoacyl peptidase